MAKFRSVIDAGADVTYTGTYDSTPEVLSLLINAGAEVNASRYDGLNALMPAARWNNASVVRALLDAGANTRLRDNEGKTALDYALENEKLKGTDIIGGLMKN